MPDRITAVTITPTIDGTAVVTESYDITIMLEKDETKPTNQTVPVSHAHGKRCKIEFSGKSGSMVIPAAGSAVDLTFTLASGVTLTDLDQDLQDIINGVYTDFGVMDDVSHNAKQNDMDAKFSCISNCGTFLS